MIPPAKLVVKEQIESSKQDTENILVERILEVDIDSIPSILTEESVRLVNAARGLLIKYANPSWIGLDLIEVQQDLTSLASLKGLLSGPSSILWGHQTMLDVEEKIIRSKIAIESKFPYYKSASSYKITTEDKKEISYSKIGDVVKKQHQEKIAAEYTRSLVFSIQSLLDILEPALNRLWYMEHHKIKNES